MICGQSVICYRTASLSFSNAMRAAVAECRQLQLNACRVCGTCRAVLQALHALVVAHNVHAHAHTNTRTLVHSSRLCTPLLGGREPEMTGLHVWPVDCH